MLEVRCCPNPYSHEPALSAVRARSESCDVEKKGQDMALRRRGICPLKSQFPPPGVMRTDFPERLRYLQDTPPSTYQLANQYVPRELEEVVAHYSVELAQKVKQKEVRLPPSSAHHAPRAIRNASAHHLHGSAHHAPHGTPASAQL